MPIAAPQRLRYASKSRQDARSRVCKHSSSIRACFDRCANCARFDRYGHERDLGQFTYLQKAVEVDYD